MTPTHTYALGSSLPELERLRRQSDGLSEPTRWLLDRLDVQSGWRVIDVGCGPRGVLDLLAERVGSDGSVTGLDANAVMVAQARAFVATMGRADVQIVHADAADTGLPRGSFDLVHARLLLANVPPAGRAKILSEMVALARPGGIVAVQDIDVGAWACDPPHPAWDTLVRVLLTIAGDGRVGRQLPRMLREAGAVAVACHAHAMFCPPGHFWRHVALHFSDLTRARALELGLITLAELDEARAALEAHLDDPGTTVLAPVVAQAWSVVGEL